MKIDLHTHSEASRDGGITAEQYAEILKNELLDCVAITDHDRIDFAKGMQKALGSENIIVGEEITTTQGEIIGLFLTEEIPSGMNAQDTIDAIRAQRGLVYIPHPFETVRKGLQKELIDALSSDIDIIEGFNGRAFIQNMSEKAVTWARRNGVVIAASSDAHGVQGLGRTYTNVHNLPTRENLVQELSTGSVVYAKPPLYTLLFPKVNRLKHLFRGQK